MTNESKWQIKLGSKSILVDFGTIEISFDPSLHLISGLIVVKIMHFS